MRLIKDHGGNAVLIAIIILGVLMTMGLVSLSLSLRNYRGVQQRITEQQEYYESTIYTE